ncbi:MAG: YaiI/YqxD family protein [Myxococcota bacterium]|nr:YaiI/YqxD family protein [Myxococcota bacterium]
MKIWVDADACPGPVKEIILRAAERLAVPAVFVANKAISLPRSELFSTVQVGKGLDVADAYVSAQAVRGDLAVTQDIPLASALVKKGVVVMDVRGQPFTEENIDERLSVRNFMQELREGGVMTGGPAGFGPQDKQRFAATFDRELSRLVREGKPPAR